MASGALLGVKPEIPLARLLQADPFVLAVVSADLDRQSPRTGQGQGGWIPLRPPAFLAIRGLALPEPLAVLLERFELLKPASRVSVAFQLDQLQKGQAVLQLINLLLVLRQPGGDGGDGACLLYTSPSPRDRQKSRMPSSA